jgi:hypothetical protein
MLPVGCCAVQFDPALISAVESALGDVITQLPPQLVEQAQEFRVARAASKTG